MPPPQQPRRIGHVSSPILQANLKPPRNAPRLDVSPSNDGLVDLANNNRRARPSPRKAAGVVKKKNNRSGGGRVSKSRTRGAKNDDDDDDNDEEDDDDNDNRNNGQSPLILHPVSNGYPATPANSSNIQPPTPTPLRAMAITAEDKATLPFLKENAPTDNVWRCVMEDTRFDDVKVEELHVLATGAFGKVVLVKLNAWKCVMKEIVEEDREDYIYPARELLMLRRCKSHPNVVRYHGYRWRVNLAGHLVVQIFMEHMSRSLSAELTRLSKLPAPQVRSEQMLHYALEIARGIAFMHSLQPRHIHRDIKPSNILLDESSERHRVKMCDFGLCTASNRVAHTSDPGTSFYKAPEVATHNYDHKADIFSYGGVLHDILFVAKGHSEHRERSHLVNCRCQLPPRRITDDNRYDALAGAVYDLMRSCLMVDPTQRPEAVDIVNFLVKVQNTSYNSGGGGRNRMSLSLSSSSSSSSSSSATLAPSTTTVATAFPTKASTPVKNAKKQRKK